MNIKKSIQQPTELIQNFCNESKRKKIMSKILKLKKKSIGRINYKDITIIK